MSKLQAACAFARGVPLVSRSRCACPCAVCRVTAFPFLCLNFTPMRAVSSQAKLHLPCGRVPRFAAELHTDKLPTDSGGHGEARTSTDSHGQARTSRTSPTKTDKGPGPK
eukprot:4256574-Prymnesium_polylepis.1